MNIALKNQIKAQIRELKRQRTAALVANNNGLADELLSKIQRLKQDVVIKPVQPKTNKEVNVMKDVKMKPALTPEVYIAFHDQGKKDKEIAILTGKTIDQLYAAKSYWKKNNKLPERFVNTRLPKSKNNTAVTPEVKVTLPAADNKELEKALARIDELEKEVAQLRIVKDIAKPLLVEWVAKL